MNLLFFTDNQTNEHAGTAGRLLPLPDLVSCHQLPPRSSTSSSSSSWSGGGPPYANTLNNNNDVNEDEDETDEDSESSSFGLKLSVECTYRSIGSDLRRIADSFDPQTPQVGILSFCIMFPDILYIHFSLPSSGFCNFLHFSKVFYDLRIKSMRTTSSNPSPYELDGYYAYSLEAKSLHFTSIFCTFSVECAPGERDQR